MRHLGFNDLTERRGFVIPKFSLSKREKLFLDKDYVCNGHWLLTRNAAKKVRGLKIVDALQHGSYPMGYGEKIPTHDCRNLTSVIPRRDGYLKLYEATQGVQLNEDKVMAYKFKPMPTQDNDFQDFEIGIDPKYVPLLRLGVGFAKGPLDPILILDGSTLNDNLVGVVMPIRLGKKS